MGHRRGNLPGISQVKGPQRGEETLERKRFERFTDGESPRWTNLSGATTEGEALVRHAQGESHGDSCHVRF